MARILIDGMAKEYPEETTWLEIAKEYQKGYAEDILLVLADRKLQELHKKVRDCERLEFVTARDKAGMLTYRRSLKFLLLKVFYEIAGEDRVKKLIVDFSLGNGYFVKPVLDGLVLTEGFLEQVKARMREYVDQKIPITKRSVSTKKAIDLFHAHGMYDKERLFNYRRVSSVNLYEIDGFEDYFYGYMVPDASYLKYFDLVLYQDGFMLLFPGADPKVVDPFKPKDRLFQVLKESCDRGRRLKLADVGDLNDWIARGRAGEMMLIEEALMEKQIGDIAARIGADRSKKFVMIAGPSSSGKTTFSHRLSIQLMAIGLNPHPIGVDDYYVNREDSPRDANGNYDYEALECIDLKQFNQDMTSLLAGERVQLPRYNFISGKREYKGDYLTLGPEDILVIEGIHGLNDRLSYALPQESKFKIYISALTSLNIDEHNRVPTTDGRLLRRIVRDARTRGKSAQDTIKMWDAVRSGEEHNIFPYQENVDAMFNSALVYELAVLKQYAEPLLFGIPKDSIEYVEAKRLLKFLDYFLGMSSEDVPKNSILREFIGGSCFRV